MHIKNLLIFIPILVVSITIHEMMHSVVAYFLGDSTARDSKRLTLNPLAHIDPFYTVAMPILLALSKLPPVGAARPVPIDTRNLKGEEFGLAVVAIAGPLTNLALAILGAVLIRWIHFFQHGLQLNVIVSWVEINVSFFVFNMIPFPPLDGSRLLYAFAPEPLQEIMRKIERFGFFGVLILLIVGGSALGGIISQLNYFLITRLFS